MAGYSLKRQSQKPLVHLVHNNVVHKMVPNQHRGNLNKTGTIHKDNVRTKSLLVNIRTPRKTPQQKTCQKQQDISLCPNQLCLLLNHKTGYPIQMRDEMLAEITAAVVVGTQAAVAEVVNH